MQIYWVNPEQTKSLAIVPRPRGGDWLDDEMLAVQREGIDVLVSLLTPEEQDELGLAQESAACVNAGIDYLNFAIIDRGTPASRDAFRSLVDHLKDLLESGKTIGAHCRAGIGRSSLLIAALLCKRGISPKEAFEIVSQARGLAVPDTLEQVQWLEQFVQTVG